EISSTGDFAFLLMYKGEIFMWRNSQRPLAVFDLRPFGLGRLIASTKEMFERAVKLSGVSQSPFNRVKGKTI
ncbi:MAG: hypothetical protein N3A62_09080, partial [Thermodesulfovibrionales bacterium]|nr:hypothetical protein [Thermodesulfovibrionales bacterium]